MHREQTRSHRVRTEIPRHPERHLAKCPATGKVRYRDAREATDVLQELVNAAHRADLDGGKHSIRVRRKYACRHCRGWHLTSQEAYASPAPDVRFAAPKPGVAWHGSPRTTALRGLGPAGLAAVLARRGG